MRKAGMQESRIPPFLISLAILCSVVRNDVIPLICRGAGNECDDRFGLAHVEYFVRHAWFDVNEIAGFVFDRLLTAGPEFVAHFSFDDIEDHFKADMDMRIGDASGR